MGAARYAPVVRLQPFIGHGRLQQGDNVPHSLSARLDIVPEAFSKYGSRAWASVVRSPASIQINGPHMSGTTRTNPPNVPHVFRWQNHGSHLPA